MKFILLPTLLLLLANCTIQKRTVNRGYFVQWHLNKKSKIANNSIALEIAKESELIQESSASEKENFELDTKQVIVETENFSEILDPKKNKKFDSPTQQISAQKSFDVSFTRSKQEKHQVLDQKIEKKKYKEKKIALVLILSGVVLFLIGLLLCTYAFSKSYMITWAFAIGFPAFLGGILIFLIGLIFLLVHFLKKRKS